MANVSAAGVAGAPVAPAVASADVHVQDVSEAAVHVHSDGTAHGPADAAREEFLMKHRGHEQLHAALLLGMLLFLVSAQVGLVYWKRRSPKTFDLVTLLGMLALPPLYALYHFYWRFLLIWAAFGAVTAFFLSKPFVERPMRATTPRQVYWFFFLLDKVSFGLAFAGYALLLLDAALGKALRAGYLATLLLFYGLLYGVIGRDLAALCADKMALSLGYASAGGLPQRAAGGGAVCAICCDTLDSVAENAITLPTCGHVFHSFCIRGWGIVGKRECPSCREKVELKHVFVQPWEKQSVLWSYVLDVTRYLVVWNPLIFGAATMAIRMLDH